MSTTDNTDVVNPEVRDTDHIAAALAAVNVASDKVNEVSERVTIDTHNNQDNMYEVQSGHAHVINPITDLDHRFVELFDKQLDKLQLTYIWKITEIMQTSTKRDQRFVGQLDEPMIMFVEQLDKLMQAYGERIRESRPARAKSIDNLNQTLAELKQLLADAITFIH